jgi:hypothetical protein
LKVYDAIGKEISVLVNEKKDAGRYKIEFDASNLASGIYFYSIAVHSENKTFAKSKKMILLK